MYGPTNQEYHTYSDVLLNENKMTVQKGEWGRGGGGGGRGGGGKKGGGGGRGWKEGGAGGRLRQLLRTETPMAR